MSGPQIAIGARVRKSPYFEASRRHGCRAYTIYNHMYLPVAYGEDAQQAYWNAVQNVQIWDVGCERQLEISGPDAGRFAQYLTPRNLSSLEPGRAVYAPLVNHLGGVVNDPVCLKISEERYWYSLADGDALLWAQGIAGQGGFDVQLDEPDVSPLQIQGPKSFHLMRDVFGEWIDSLPFYRFREVDLDGIPIIVARMGYSRELCYELFLRDGSKGDELWQRCWDAGLQYDVSPGAPSQELRIEGGLLSYQTDMDLSHNPYEAGLGWTVDLDQPHQFIAKEALSRIKADGIKRRIVGVGIDGEALGGFNEHHWPVHKGAEEVGYLTTCAWSPRLRRNIGLAMLDKPYDQTGSKVTIDNGSQSWGAVVEPLPFIKARGAPPDNQ